MRYEKPFIRTSKVPTSFAMIVMVFMSGSGVLRFDGSTVEHCSHIVQVKTLMQSDARCAKLCSMKTSDIRARLTPLRTAELERLSELSGVSLRTLWGIRSGKTETASESTKEKLIQGFKHMPRRARKGEK